MNQINQLNSPTLQAIAKQLLRQNHRITYFGKAWGKPKGNWVYFDTVLEVEALKNEFQVGEHIIIHENLDPRSGTERGFFDTNTEEGLMGRLK